MSRVLAVIGLAMLSGCGFQLQGALTMPAEMQRTYLDPVDKHSLFHRELRLQLQAAGVELVDTPDNSTAILSIRIDETDQRVLSVSGRNVPTEYEVYYTVEYSIASGEKILLAPQDITLTRDYTYDTTKVLGKSREEAILREAVVKDLVRTVLKQISSL
ncbi:MAG: LPS assembly lipoprotein LptE [Gammaproteobacteria bacterium]|nr:LPS assembly lipoprotein LptE [Gammaproteobacteria bacterium]MDH3416492.1 LPS assembly lipoprotein LptE [Gammaproteobacteria bacterium]